MTRWAAWDELPTTIATVSPARASRMAVAAAISSSATMPWRRSNSQAASLARNAQLILAYARRNPRFDVTHARAAGLAPPPIDDYFVRLVSYAQGTDFGATLR